MPLAWGERRRRSCPRHGATPRRLKGREPNSKDARRKARLRPLKFRFPRLCRPPSRRRIAPPSLGPI